MMPSASAVPPPAKVTDLNFSRYLSRDKPLHVGVLELVSNAFDASANAKEPHIGHNGSTLTVRNVGKSLGLGAFVMGPSNDMNVERHGQNHIGLKDAIAISMQIGKSIAITSGEGRFTFSERTGPLGASTIHCSHEESTIVREPFTEVTISRVTAEEWANIQVELNKRVLSCAGLGEPLHPYAVADGVHLDVYATRNASGTGIFINGMLKTHVSKLELTYNFRGPAGGVFGRDHYVSEDHGKRMNKLIKKALLSMDNSARATVRELLPEPKAELTWGSMREVFGYMPAPQPPKPESGTTPPTHGAPTPLLHILVDYENAANAAKCLSRAVAPDGALAGKCVRVYVICGGGREQQVLAAGVDTGERLKIVPAETDGREAADTVLIILATKLDITLDTSARILIVAGAERRFGELVEQLRAQRRRKAQYHQYNTATTEASDKALHGAVTSFISE